MQATLPVQVELTEDEQRLFDQIDFGSGLGHEYIESGEASRKLMESLVQRSAIPEVRQRYFFDPELNLHSPGKSRFDIFKKNIGENDIREHRHFLKYLKYFIKGPDLPEAIMREFCRIVNDVIDMEEELLKFVRKEMRNTAKSERTYLPEEFYKLALECLPYQDPLAGMVRKAAMSVR